MHVVANCPLLLLLATEDDKVLKTSAQLKDFTMDMTHDIVDKV